MKNQLGKVNHEIYKEYYEGETNDKMVWCSLDDNCVRFVVCIRGKYGWKAKSRKEFDNHQKAECLAAATKALNA